MVRLHALDVRSHGSPKHAGEQKYDVCGRCDYTACTPCRLDKKLGSCYCKNENFGVPYPPLSKRKFYQTGIW